MTPSQSRIQPRAPTTVFTNTRTSLTHARLLAASKNCGKVRTKVCAGGARGCRGPRGSGPSCAAGVARWTRPLRAVAPPPRHPSGLNTLRWRRAARCGAVTARHLFPVAHTRPSSMGRYSGAPWHTSLGSYHDKYKQFMCICAEACVHVTLRV